MNSFPNHATMLRPVSGAGQTAASVLVVVSLIVLIAVAIRIRQRRGTWIGVILLVTTFLASFFEVSYDTVSDFWYYVPGQHSLYQLWGRGLPVWALCSYSVFYGGIGMAAWWLVECGGTRRQMVEFLLAIWVVFVAAEVLFVNIHVYVYYGRQPFRIAGFPMWISLPNSTACVALGICAARLRPILSGRREWQMLALGPPVIAAALVGTTFPTVDAIHAYHPSVAFLDVSALLTTVMAAAAAWLVVQLVPRSGLAKRPPDRPMDVAKDLADRPGVRGGQGRPDPPRYA